VGIRVDFLIKHVRPYGLEAYTMITGPRGPGSFHYWLSQSGLTDQQINDLFTAWAFLATTQIDDTTKGQFIRAAQDIAEARWEELYKTDYSTILFLDGSLLTKLSQASSEHPNQAFNFSNYPQEGIPLAVTISRPKLPQPPTTVFDAVGVRVEVDPSGNCFHFVNLIKGGTAMNTVTALPTEAVRRWGRTAALAEQIFDHAGEQAAIQRMHQFFGISPALVPAPSRVRVAPAASSPSPDDFAAMLNNAGLAPGASTVVTVPAAPISGDAALIQNVQLLDSYIAVLTALVMYNNHPQAYNLSDKTDAAQFVIDLANARNLVVTGGTVKAIPMYLPMGQATTESMNRSTTSADLHLDLLSALFGALNLPTSVLAELDGILTEIADSLKNLQLSFTTQTQTLNHFVSFYYLTPVPGANPQINQMNVEFIYLQIDQSSWQAAVGKSSVSNFTLDMTTTRTTATMSSGVVAANASSIANSLLRLTNKDQAAISEMTQMKGVKT
jgi:hypothetical protein